MRNTVNRARKFMIMKTYSLELDNNKVCQKKKLKILEEETSHKK